LSWIGSDIWLGANNISCVVDNIACGVSGSIGWRVGRGVGGSVGSRVDRLYYFVSASSFFSHGLNGTITAMSLERVF
jgi:hypothetical protein